MRVRVQDQPEAATVAADPDGIPVLCLRPGLVSPAAFVALVLALGPLCEQSYEYLKNAG